LFRNEKVAVAMHIRRGDALTQEDWIRNYVTPDEYYLKLARTIRQELPNAEFHAWSEGDNASFKAFWRNGIHVHLGGDLLTAWAHWSVARVFLMAKSSFSFVPALLNSKCVVYQRQYQLPVSSWIVASGREDGPIGKVINFDVTEPLKSCLRATAWRGVPDRGARKSGSPSHAAELQNRSIQRR